MQEPPRHRNCEATIQPEKCGKDRTKASKRKYKKKKERTCSRVYKGIIPSLKNYYTLEINGRQRHLNPILFSPWFINAHRPSQSGDVTGLSLSREKKETIATTIIKKEKSSEWADVSLMRPLLWYRARPLQSAQLQTRSSTSGAAVERVSLYCVGRWNSDGAKQILIGRWRDEWFSSRLNQLSGRRPS